MSAPRNTGVKICQKRFGARSRKKSTRMTTRNAYIPHEISVEERSALRFTKNIFFIDKEIFVRFGAFGHNARTAHDRRQRVRSDPYRNAEHLREYLWQTAQERAAAKNGHALL